jgi:choline-sulfatase
MKVPLVVKLPDQKAPVEVLENCSLVDLLPTFLDVANIDFSNFRRDLNGQSLMGLLTKNEENWGDEVLAEYTADATMEPVVMIRNRQYKYIAAQNDPELLFDLKSDANELSNLAHEKRFESVIETFRRRVSEVWDLDDLGRRVRISQKNRMIVRDAMKEGQLVNWDFSPTTDYSDLYVRSSNSHEVVDRKVRIKAKGYQLPISSTAK